jgi:hypothetical protein
MAAKQDSAPGAQRLAAVAAVALLSAATAIAFGRVFVGHAATWKLTLAAIVSVGLAAAFERRSLLLATAVSALGLVVVVGVLVFPESTWFGLPTRETLRAALDALGRVGHDARVQVSPSEPLRPLVLAAVTAVWTASFAAHALAVRAASPLLSVLPAAALIGFADTVLDDGARPAYALLLLVAAMLVVFTDGLRRIRGWGPVWSAPGRRRLSTVAGRGARRVGVVTLVAAIAFPGVLPGFRDDALVDFSTNGSQGIHLDPFVSIRAKLTSTTPVTEFTVRATDDRGDPYAGYWRSFALDQFDGQDWTSSRPDASGGVVLPPSTSLARPITPSPDVVTRVRETVHLMQPLEDTPLPMAFPASYVNVPDATQVRYDENLGAVAIPGPAPSGLTYHVVSDVVVPTADELAGVTPSSTKAIYTHVPDDLPPIVGITAKRWAGTGDPIHQILNIMRHFATSGEFHYSIKDVGTSEDENALVDFLRGTHTGFCQQFATAMAVMVRSIGYPARVAVGYRMGTPHDGVYTVTSRDAHSWVEVLFPGFGWLAFEPTPDRPNPIEQQTNSYLNPVTPTGGSVGPERNPGSTVGTGTAGSDRFCILSGHRVPISVCQHRLGSTVGLGLNRHGAGGGVGRFGAGTRDPYGVPLRLLLLAFLLVALVLLVLVPIVKWIVRLRIAHRRRAPNETVLAAYRLFDGEAADVGLGRRPGETLTEFRERLAERVRSSDGHLARLTAVASRAAYSDAEIDRDDARAALRDARVAIRDVRREAGIVRRVIGVYRPGI